MLAKYPAHLLRDPIPFSYHTAITSPRPPENPSSCRIPEICVVHLVIHASLGIAARIAPDATDCLARMHITPGTSPTIDSKSSSYVTPLSAGQARERETRDEPERREGRTTYPPIHSSILLASILLSIHGEEEVVSLSLPPSLASFRTCQPTRQQFVGTHAKVGCSDCELGGVARPLAIEVTQEQYRENTTVV